MFVFLTTKSVRNRHQINPNRPQIDPKSIQNRSRVEPNSTHKSLQNRPRNLGQEEDRLLVQEEDHVQEEDLELVQASCDIGDVPEPGHVVRWIRLEKSVRILSLPHYFASVWIFYDQI